MAKPKLKEVDAEQEAELDASSYIEYDDDIADAEAPIPLPENSYPATIVKVERKASAKGGEHIAVSFKVEEDDYPADYPVENSPGGKTLVYRRLNPDASDLRARYQMRKFIEAIGAPKGKRLVLGEWIGLNALIHVVNTKFEGEDRDEIKKVESID